NVNYGFGNCLTEEVFGCRLELRQDLGADLWRSHVLTSRVDPSITVLALDDLVRNALWLVAELLESPADEAFGGVDDVLGIGHGLPLGDLTDENSALLVPRNDAWRHSRAFLVHDHSSLFAIHDCDHDVRRAQVYPNDLTHL